MHTKSNQAGFVCKQNDIHVVCRTKLHTVKLLSVFFFFVFLPTRLHRLHVAEPPSPNAGN